MAMVEYKERQGDECIVWSPDIAVRLVYTMNKEGLEATELSLNCYPSGKRLRESPITKPTPLGIVEKLILKGL